MLNRLRKAFKQTNEEIPEQESKSEVEVKQSDEQARLELEKTIASKSLIDYLRTEYYPPEYIVIANKILAISSDDLPIFIPSLLELYEIQYHFNRARNFNDLLIEKLGRDYLMKFKDDRNGWSTLDFIMKHTEQKRYYNDRMDDSLQLFLFTLHSSDLCQLITSKEKFAIILGRLSGCFVYQKYAYSFIEAFEQNNVLHALLGHKGAEALSDLKKKNKDCYNLNPILAALCRANIMKQENLILLNQLSENEYKDLSRLLYSYGYLITLNQNMFEFLILHRQHIKEISRLVLFYNAEYFKRINDHDPYPSEPPHPSEEQENYSEILRDIVTRFIEAVLNGESDQVPIDLRKQLQKEKETLAIVQAQLLSQEAIPFSQYDDNELLLVAKFSFMNRRKLPRAKLDPLPAEQVNVVGSSKIFVGKFRYL